jgi:transcriptional regulator with XRE-family HTH domain
MFRQGLYVAKILKDMRGYSLDRAMTRKRKDRLDRIIGKNIRTEREMHKMSREELAETLDLTVSHMGLIERGERGATAVTLEKLAHVFDVKIDALFTEHDSKSLPAKEETANDAVAVNCRKITGLLPRLNKEETEFIIHAIRGLISIKPARTLNGSEDFE